MKTLVTGATGFIGSAVVRELLAEGVAVRALVRRNADRRNIAGLDIEIIEGELQDAASLVHACRGCDALFHLAADYRLWSPRPEEIYRVNVDGTRAVLNAAAQAGVSRVLYTSSVATLEPLGAGKLGDEETPASLMDMAGHYKRSKFMAEAVVREFVANGLSVVTVNPAAPVGPRDVKPTPTGRMILDAAAGRIPAYVDTGLSIVHVDDVARGHWLAFSRGRVGERYVLGGANMTLRQILTDIARLVGRKPPRIRLPHNFVLPVAYLSEAAARLTGKTPAATVESVKLSKKMMFFSSSKAERELGYWARPAQAALKDAICWFLDNGYLKVSAEARRRTMAICDKEQWSDDYGRISRP